MLIWSGWGLVVALLIALGLLATFALHDVLQQFLPYGPAGSLSFLIGGAFWSGSLQAARTGSRVTAPSASNCGAPGGWSC